ncbi:MAG: TolC family protein [Proteobacteria bacterium]|nr:TolC family protein [Pseudomonadota bacterium]
MKAVLIITALSFISTVGVCTPLTLDAVLSSVRERYPLVEGAQKDVEAAGAEIRSSEGAFDIQWKTRVASSVLGYYQNDRLDSLIEKPTTLWGTNLFAGYRLGVGDFAIYDGKLKTNPGGELRAGFNIPLWRDGPTDRRRANIGRAKLGLQVADLQVIQQRIDAVKEASNRYWDWVSAAKKVEIYQALLKIAVERDDGLKERVKHGDLPEFERRDNERAILQRRSQLISAERSLQQATIDLSLYFRDKEGNPIFAGPEHLGANLPTPNPEAEPKEGLEKALKSRPDLNRFQLLKGQNEIELELAENQTAPKIDIQVQAIRSLQNGDPVRNGTQLEAGIQLEVPLQVNVAGGREDFSKATLARLELQERFLKDKIAVEVYNAKSALNAALLRAQVTEQETQLAKKLEQGERVRFRQGDSNQLFVNIREQATADAAVREVDALADYLKSLANLHAALGES